MLDCHHRHHTASTNKNIKGFFFDSLIFGRAKKMGKQFSGKTGDQSEFPTRKSWKWKLRWVSAWEELNLSVTRWTPLSDLSVRLQCPRIVANRTPVHLHCEPLCRALPPDLTLTFVRTVRHLLSAPLTILLQNIWCGTQSCSLNRHSRVNRPGQWKRSPTMEAMCWKITSKGPHHIALHRIASHWITLNHIALHHIGSHCITLHDTRLQLYGIAQHPLHCNWSSQGTAKPLFFLTFRLQTKPEVWGLLISSVGPLPDGGGALGSPAHKQKIMLIPTELPRITIISIKPTNITRWNQPRCISASIFQF